MRKLASRQVPSLVPRPIAHATSPVPDAQGQCDDAKGRALANLGRANRRSIAALCQAAMACETWRALRIGNALKTLVRTATSTCCSFRPTSRRPWSDRGSRVRLDPVPSHGATWVRPHTPHRVGDPAGPGGQSMRPAERDAALLADILQPAGITGNRGSAIRIRVYGRPCALPGGREVSGIAGRPLDACRSRCTSGTTAFPGVNG